MTDLVVTNRGAFRVSGSQELGSTVVGIMALTRCRWLMRGGLDGRCWRHGEIGPWMHMVVIGVCHVSMRERNGMILPRVVGPYNKRIVLKGVSIFHGRSVPCQ
jgi:hypothetical protein